jgi:TonB family protein
MNRSRIFLGSVLTHALLIGVVSIGASLQGCSMFGPKEQITEVSLMGSDDPAIGGLDGGKTAAAPEEQDATPTPPEPEVAKQEPADDPDAIPEPEQVKPKPEKPKEVVKKPDPPKEKTKPKEITKGKPVVREVAKAEKPKTPEKPKEDPRLKTMKFVDAKELGGSKMANPMGKTNGEFGSSMGRVGGNGPLGNGGASLAIDQYIYEAMYAAWEQPKSVPGGTRAKVSGTLMRSGQVTNIKMVLPSGDPEFDQSVIAAARRVTRINFPPSMMTGSTFDFVVVYEMKGDPLSSLSGY